MAKKSMSATERELRLCTLPETWLHIEGLMKLANSGNSDAGILAKLALDRYFERVDAAALQELSGK